MDESPDPRIENAILAVASVGALFAAFAFVLFRVATGISVTAGAVVATLNLGSRLDRWWWGQWVS